MRFHAISPNVDKGKAHPNHQSKTRLDNYVVAIAESPSKAIEFRKLV